VSDRWCIHVDASFRSSDVSGRLMPAAAMDRSSGRVQCEAELK
jgi:hypothetical protein